MSSEPTNGTMRTAELKQESHTGTTQAQTWDNVYVLKVIQIIPMPTVYTMAASALSVISASSNRLWDQTSVRRVQTIGKPE